MHLTLQHFFDADRVNFHAFVGWMVVLANLINSVAAALYLMFVVCCGPRPRLPAPAHTRTSSAPLLCQVERAKKCLDFAATIYIVHFGVVSLLSGMPRTLSWCAGRAGCAAVG